MSDDEDMFDLSDLISQIGIESEIQHHSVSDEIKHENQYTCNLTQQISCEESTKI